MEWLNQLARFLGSRFTAYLCGLWFVASAVGLTACHTLDAEGEASSFAGGTRSPAPRGGALNSPVPPSGEHIRDVVDETGSVVDEMMPDQPSMMSAGIPMSGGAPSTGVSSDMSAGARIDEPVDLSDEPTAGDLGQPSAGETMMAGVLSDAVAGGEPVAEGPEVSLDIFEHFSLVLDIARGEQLVWAYFIHVDHRQPMPRFIEQNYGDRGTRTDFWPASTIKMFAATAVLELMTELGVGLEATATFFRLTDGQWIEDITMTFREMIHRTFNCSSNETYTLLLRFAGLDWINSAFFTAENGFNQTALMRDYVGASARPHAYVRQESQRIIIQANGRTWTREHSWSGRSYANEVGCTIYNETGTGNCTSAQDMAEHLKRIIFHEVLPEDMRFDISAELLNWYREGGPEFVLNNIQGNRCGGPAFDGVTRVFGDVTFHHKGGRVSDYRGSIFHVRDAESRTEYVAAIMVNESGERVLRDLSEETALMARTPGLYVHLASLTDHVNPIQANLTVVSPTSGMLDLITKPYAEDARDPQGWTPLAGTGIEIPEGTSDHRLRSICLDRSEKVHIRGRLRTDDGREAQSDLHYVIVDHDIPCQND